MPSLEAISCSIVCFSSLRFCFVAGWAARQTSRRLLGRINARRLPHSRHLDALRAHRAFGAMAFTIGSTAWLPWALL